MFEEKIVILKKKTKTITMMNLFSLWVKVLMIYECDPCRAPLLAL